VAKKAPEKTKKRPPRKPAEAPAEEPEPTAPPSGWARLSKGTKALVALIGTTAVAAVVPGVIPYASDRVLDLFHAPIVDVSSVIGSSLHGLQEAATEVVSTAPVDVGQDPRYIPAGYALTTITLEGKRSATVSVLDATVEVDATLPPRRGTLFSIPPQGEADNTVVDLDLDSPRPALAASGGAGPYFVGKHITLDRGEVWVIDVQSRTTRHEYAWRLHLHLRYRGVNHDLTVPPAGSPPFRMTAFVAPADYQRQFAWNAQGVLLPHDCLKARKACAALELPAVRPPS
jgi:hypothetical protein